MENTGLLLAQPRALNSLNRVGWCFIKLSGPGRGLGEGFRGLRGNVETGSTDSGLGFRHGKYMETGFSVFGICDAGLLSLQWGHKYRLRRDSNV